MNLSLLDPFYLTQDYPDSLQAELRAGHSTVIRFNRKGDLLASGRVDGTVVLFDVETNSLARVLKGHIRQVQYLSWSDCGKYLVSCAQDFKAIRWDLSKTGEGTSHTTRFSAPVYCAELHPTDVNLFVSSLFEDTPYLCTLSPTSDSFIKTALPTTPYRLPTADPEADAKRALADAKQLTTCSIFTLNGRFIITGTNKGWINIISLRTLKVLHSHRFTTGCVTYLRLSNSGRNLAINSSDRIIRSVILPEVLWKSSDPSDASHPNPPSPATKPDGPTETKPDESMEALPSSPSESFELPPSFTLTEEHRFQDVVNRLLWNHVCFSSTSDILCASTYHNHELYIWDRSAGTLLKILEGPKEELGSTEWHPSRPLIAAVGLETGRIYVWGIVVPQRWSALAPDFAEVEENVEYDEKEGEFDVLDEGVEKRRRLGEETETVNVLDMEGKEGEEGWRMPVMMEVEQEGGRESEEEGVRVEGPKGNRKKKEKDGGGTGTPPPEGKRRRKR